MIRDRGGRFPALFDAVLTDAGIEVVLSGVRMPRMNSIIERWVQTCRRELLDRTLIWNQRHLLHALREYQSSFGNRVRRCARFVLPGRTIVVCQDLCEWRASGSAPVIKPAAVPAPSDFDVPVVTISAQSWVSAGPDRLP
jgi:hypothetical protein